VDEEEVTSEETKSCEECERAIPMDAVECPHCGAEQRTIEPDILKTAHD
jgi:RNA polymerase subunit RPABC4/transcription elongation factor Spt4